MIRQQRRWAICLSGALLASLVCATAGADDSLPAIHFSLKPRLCVLTDNEEVCRDELEVTWSSAHKRSLCLYQDGEPMPLQCWTDSTKGAYRFLISASASTNFQLREDHSEQAVGKEVFEVVHHQKTYRRQRRNPWNFF